MYCNYRKWNLLGYFIVLYFCLQGAVCFFVKHVQTGPCIKDTSNVVSGKVSSWGNLSLVEFTNNCLDPAAQFQFRDNGAMLNLRRKGCLAAYAKSSKLLNLDMFYVYASKNLDASACASATRRAITQTSGGGLSVKYKGYKKSSFQTWCTVPKTNSEFTNNYGIDRYVGLTTPCDDAEDKRFNFGSVTCHGNVVKNVNCPKDQYMVVKTASYRGLSASKTCGLSDNHTCQVDVTCFIKEQCDGQHECSFTVDDNLFPVDLCPGLSKYLYFEYQCVNSSETLKDICVLDVSLSNSPLPNEGFVKVTTDSGTKSVCKESLKNKAKNVVCQQLGYPRADGNLLEKTAPSGDKDARYSGSIDCTGGEKYLFQCPTTTSTKSCSKISYLKCFICSSPLLENKQRIPDSSFTASASSEGHSASDARISSGSSWCAPVSNDNHYLQVDFGRLNVLNTFATFGDSSSSKWMTSFTVNYTQDLINWTPFENKKIFEGNKNAHNDGAIYNFNGLVTRAVRFIPLTSNVQACMRIQLCGATLLPDEPQNLKVSNIKSRSAKLSWLNPENEGDKPVIKFLIKLKKENKPILNTTTAKVYEYEITNLSPFTEYEISVAAGNANGFGDENDTSFTTSEEAPDGPPLSLKVTAKKSSSLSVTWGPPEKKKRNGEIVNYTVCISHEESKPCFEEYTTDEQMFVISNLNESTKYYVRVLASTKVGPGNYSESKGVFTNGKPPELAINKTESTLTFQLQIPSRNYTHFFVVAMKLKGKQPNTPDSYENDKLVTYAEAQESTNPKPYIAAVVTSSGLEGNMFVLGDGKNSSDPTGRRRRSTSSGYYNGPLEPGASYSIFQRIFIDKDQYYSTDWSQSFDTNHVETTPAPSEGRSEKNGDGDDNNVPIIAGAVAGVCILLIIVVLIIFMFRRRNSKQDSKPPYEKDEEVEKPSSVDSVTNDTYLASIEVEQNGNSDEQDEAPPLQAQENVALAQDEKEYGNKESIFARIHNPIPVEEFSDHVNNLRLEDKKEFKLEFEDLPTGRTSNWDISKRAFNTPKNRYGNAVTYDHSRVVLSGDEKTDYINASYMDGLSEKYYIATQGPKPKTVNDFWRMIFEHKCPTIVMLTTLMEMRKVKCEKYWPDESETYGEIIVTVKKTRTFADYVTRIFILQKGDEHHGVQQFHFKSWPDYGVPQYPTQILTFRRHFKSCHETETGPAVIHCSAGVGRTGVFIAVDKILDDLDKEKKENIDIFGFVKDMRTRRVNMVQTSDQYVFIHDTIVDHIKCGANEVEATRVLTEIKNLSKKNEKGETGFEEKFQRLNRVSPQLVKEQCETALLEENRKKNRNPEIYPSESGRTHIRHMENVDNSDYINACFIDGYLGRNYFIATQTPLDETINDFWRMVYQHNSSTIVMLNQLREEDEEYPMFWPTQRAKPQSFGPTTVMLDSFVKKEAIVVRKFIVSPSPDLKEGHKVQMIQYMSWPDHGVPENVDDIVKILCEVEDSQRAVEKKGPVTVVCSDGAGRSGTYIAISNLVDRVKLVQVIDVFQCIKLIRSRRTQFVETVTQFKLCYDAVTSVLKSFDEYSNFILEE